MRKERVDNDRERILCSIAAVLASELASLQALPAVREYLADPYNSNRIRANWFCKDLKPGDLVVCATSAWRQKNPWVLSIVEHVGIEGDPRGAQLRAIGTSDLCDYGNESFTRIEGIPERLLWEGEQFKFSIKLGKAFREFDSHTHRFRGLEFDLEKKGLAHVFVGQMFSVNTKPYEMLIDFNRRTTIKSIVAQMAAQGFGTRKFEVDDGKYHGPMEGCATFTRELLVKSLEAQGIKLKKVDQEKTTDG